MSSEVKGIWDAIKGIGRAIKTWWGSDALSSKTVRVPLKLLIVGAAAVAVLAFGLYGAKKVAERLDPPAAVATAAQLTEFRSQIIAACAPPAKVEPVKKAPAKRK